MEERHLQLEESMPVSAISFMSLEVSGIIQFEDTEVAVEEVPIETPPEPTEIAVEEAPIETPPEPTEIDADHVVSTAPTKAAKSQVTSTAATTPATTAATKAAKMFRRLNDAKSASN